MSSIGRTLLGNKSCFYNGKYTKPFLNVISLQVTTERGVRGRQPTGMAGHISPYIRIPFFYDRGPGIGQDKNLQERLQEMFSKNCKPDERVDIGFKPVTRDDKSEKVRITELIRKNRANRQLEKAAREGKLKVDLASVREEWEARGGLFSDLFDAAELYGINEDLFRHGYFHPCVNLSVAYPGEEDTLIPVYRGNVVKPREATVQPEVNWESRKDDVWCLVLTGLDTNFTQEGMEYLHWMVCNIKGSDLTSGEEVCNYLRPFPPFGTGYHRYAFLLYKQEKMLDLTEMQRIQGVDLGERTFSTFDFYTKHQDGLTPAGLAFFQSDYDSSVRECFHNVLNMKEPRYEYEFPKPYIRQWDNFYQTNKKKGFNEFLDRHRDPKEFQKEILEKKLAHTHPFHGDTEGYLQFPAAHEAELGELFPAPVGEKPLNPRQSFKIPQWRRNAIQKERSKQGYFQSTDHTDLRRDPSWSS